MSLDINLTNVQSKAVVVSTNTTAVNDGNYTVVANATFTDPSPIEGKGYRVFVRNGTATINSVGYTVGTSILRLFHSGAWVSYVSLPDSNFVPTSRTINGLDLSANRTLTASDVGAVATNSAITGATKTKITYDAKGLVTSSADATTADIDDSTNKRYQTDAQKTSYTNPIITVELIDAVTVNFYASYSYQIDSVTNIVNTPTTTILVNNLAYTLGTAISIGDKITVSVNTVGVINLNTTRL
jgi:hypothetical protein